MLIQALAFSFWAPFSIILMFSDLSIKKGARSATLTRTKTHAASNHKKEGCAMGDKVLLLAAIAGSREIIAHQQA